ncbi:Coiled-coil domain-containing protein 58, partial [Tyrophagus putrescentiae]
ETLKSLRKVDDNIVHALNTTIPTSSFSEKGIDPSAQCQELYKQLNAAHQSRENAIKKCIVSVSERVHNLRKQRDEDGDNLQVTKELKKEQNKLRMMQNELHVEEVVCDRSSKIFHERCRLFFRP